MNRKYFAVLPFMILVAVATASAQSSRVGVYRGTSEYDLSGVDQTTVTAVRAGHDFGRYLGVEAGVVFANVMQSFGETSLYLPDLHLQARLPLGSLTPYVGAGAGMGIEKPKSDQLETDVRSTFSAALGLRIALPARLLLGAEGRLRTFGTGFAASGAEGVAGIGFRF